MKTAVSIPDELFQEVDELARRLGKSRSQLYREALAEYLARRDPHEVTRAMDETLEGLATQADPWLSEAGRRALERVDW
jgi:metal-responsive CopG/Arc/MetJ family transcriptional regulator